MTAERTLHLSPSEHHGHLMATTTPALRYPGSPTPGWPAQLRAKLAELLGVPDRAAGTAAAVDVATTADAATLWERRIGPGTVTKLVLPAEPGADMLAYFCVPAGVEPPYPTVICLQGHTSGMHHSIARQREDESAPLAVEGDRDFALGAMRHGFAALCIEQRSFGERRETLQAARSQQGCHDAAMHALMLGRTLAGERVFDVDRGIDYLAARGDVDMARVGVMGNSGGGTVTIYAAALLDRLAFAMPSCSFCTYAGSVMSIYHCACNYVPGLLQWAECADVLGLFAPRPVVVVAGRDDGIFPLPAVQQAVADLRAVYADAGAADRCRLVVGDGGHRFYEEPAWRELLDLLG